MVRFFHVIHAYENALARIEIEEERHDSKAVQKSDNLMHQMVMGEPLDSIQTMPSTKRSGELDPASKQDKG